MTGGRLERTGGYVRTLREGFPDGLYADCGAEHFTKLRYDLYYPYAAECGLTVLPPSASRQSARGGRPRDDEWAGCRAVRIFARKLQRKGAQVSEGPPGRQAHKVGGPAVAGSSRGGDITRNSYWDSASQCSGRTQRCLSLNA